MSDYFKQSETDSKVFMECFARYGVQGILTALQNTLRYQPDNRRCSNNCTVTNNVLCELQRAARAIERHQEDAFLGVGGPVGDGEREERINDAWATRMGFTD